MNSTLIKRVVAIAGLAMCLTLVNWKIFEKETHLSTGQVVLLKLAPVDPRSLMQGDFMALRYEIEPVILQTVSEATDNRDGGIDGLAWVTLNKDNVAQLRNVTLGNDPAPQDSQQLIPLQFRVRASTVKLGTDAFFFQEGTGSIYESADYGKFRVNEDGELLLTGLVGENLETITPPTN